MALLGFIKSREEEAGEPVLRDRPTILAYMEELIRLHTPIQVWIRKGDLTPASARIELLKEDETNMLLCLQRAIPGDINSPTPMETFFMIDGMRFRTQIKFKARDAYMKAIFQVPEVVRHAERRCKMRSRFSAREKASVMALEGLFEGTGVSGALVNLSMEGLCLRIERAISIRDDRKVPVTAGIFQIGRPLPVVRITNLPQTPGIECAATVAHISMTPSGVLMGLRLDCVGEWERQILEQVMTRRLPRFGRGFPVKRRWSELHIDVREPREDEDWDGTEVEALEDQEAPETAPEDPAMVEQQEQHRRLLCLKKRGKRILVVAKDEMDRAIIAGILMVDGYSRVLEAGNLLEALAACRKGPLDLIIIDHPLGGADATEVVTKLRSHADCAETPVIMLTDFVGVRTSLKARAAKIDHLQTKPLDYDGEMRDVLNRLLQLA